MIITTEETSSPTMLLSPGIARTGSATIVEMQEGRMAPPKRAFSSHLRDPTEAPRILVCPSGFKGSLQPNVAADCIRKGIHRVLPKAQVMRAPLVDGGEGFCEALVDSTRGELHRLEVLGPVGQPIQSHFGFLGGIRMRVAVVEMAAAAGLSLVPKNKRNPLFTTSYGVGQLIEAALDKGAEHIIVGCGDSGTCDGGVGMAQALGARFYTSQNTEIARGADGSKLHNLSRVDLSGLHARLSEVTIDAAVNWHNLLCGDHGVARVFGPQKGAGAADVELLAQAMNNVATVVDRSLGLDVALAPGVGASGGLGAGLTLIGAKLHPRYDIIMQFLDLDTLLENCDIVMTGEGAIDYQTPQGKIPAEVAQRARRHGVPVIALAGTVGEGAKVNYERGIHAYVSIISSPMTLEKAEEDAEQLLADGAESAIRMIWIGWTLGRKSETFTKGEANP